MLIKINTNKIQCPLHDTFTINQHEVHVLDFGELIDAEVMDFDGPCCNDRIFKPYPVKPELRDRLNLSETEYSMIIDILLKVNFHGCTWCN